MVVIAAGETKCIAVVVEDGDIEETPEIGTTIDIPMEEIPSKPVVMELKIIIFTVKNVSGLPMLFSANIFYNRIERICLKFFLKSEKNRSRGEHKK